MSPYYWIRPILGGLRLGKNQKKMVITTRIQISTRRANLVLTYFKIAPSNPNGNKFLAAAITIIGPVLPANIILMGD